MRKYEDECVGCPPEKGCMGSACPCTNVPHDYCDVCGEDSAKYRIDGNDLCEECAELYFQEYIKGIAIMELAELFKINCERIRE